MQPEEYNLFSYICSLYLVILDGLAWYILWKRTAIPDGMRMSFRDRNQSQKTFTVITAVLLIAVNLTIVFLPVRFGTRFLLSGAILFVYSSWIEGVPSGRGCFLLTLFYGFHSFSFMIAVSAFQTHSKTWLDAFVTEQPVDLDAFYWRLALIQGFLLLFYSASLLLMIMICGRVVKIYWKIKWQDIPFLCVLNVVGAMLAHMISDLSQVSVAMGEGVFALYDDRKEMIWKIPCLAILLFIGEMTAIYLYQSYIHLQKEKEQRFIERQRAEALQLRLEEVEQLYGNVRKVRHEMKNHMMNLKGLAAGGEYKEVEKYIEKLDETIEALDYTYRTGNPVTDVIVNDKYRIMQQKKITFTMDFDYTETDALPSFDIGILLNNLLDNALEASERVEEGNRYIRLHVKEKTPFLLIEVENRFDGKPLITKKDGLLQSTKTDGLSNGMDEHGFGLRNVREIAERHLGSMEIHVEGDRFRILVTLQGNPDSFLKNGNTTE